MPRIVLDPALQIALQQHRAGQLNEAEEGYRRVLGREPNHPQALHFMGVLADQRGRSDVAIPLIERALAIDPEYADARRDLARIFRGEGKTDEAIAQYRRALETEPESIETRNNLAMLWQAAGRNDEAEKEYEAALQIAPNCAEIWNNFGNLMQAGGRLEAAKDAFEKALRVKPAYADGHFNLGRLLETAGNLDGAADEYRKALECDANHAAALAEQGNLLGRLGRHREAIPLLCRAVRQQPENAAAHARLGYSLQAVREVWDALTSFREAVRLEPACAGHQVNLGNALKADGQIDEAVAAYREALRLEPDNARTQSNLGRALRAQGELELALQCYRRATELEPNAADLQSNLIYAMGFEPSADAASIRAECRRWDERHAAPLRAEIRPHENDRSPERRLRVGYVSPDFCEHVVGCNLRPLFREHDHSQVEIYCYSNGAYEDALTAELRKGAHGWRNIAGLPDARVAEMIRADGIDILVDLALHTARNRLLVFARKPAPVQVSYLGYCGDAGIESIEHRLSDRYLDPPCAETDASEGKVIRLAQSYWCYEPARSMPPIGSLPARQAGRVTFGCLNNFGKVSSAALDLWLEILANVPRSRLLLHAPVGLARLNVLRRFRANGIAADRIEFVAQQPWNDYLGSWQRIDIGLDPFPYGGGITTCDALRMGVPIVTLAGKSALSRAGCSILSNACVPNLIADTPADYRRIAAELAGDLPRLSELRRSLRERVDASPLRDAKNFAQDIEAAYRQMWRRWAEIGN